MVLGDVVNIPVRVKHWHGAAPDNCFFHLTVEVTAENGSNKWLEQVDDEQYGSVSMKVGAPFISCFLTVPLCNLYDNLIEKSS